jgi:hypothetical protein
VRDRGVEDLFRHSERRSRGGYGVQDVLDGEVQGQGDDKLDEEHHRRI